MNPYRIAVPPGIGDIYWALTKIQAFKEQVGATSIEICVQRAGPGRSTLWADMVDFIDSACFLPFSANTYGLANGLGYVATPANLDADCIMWPNAVVDRGKPLSTWLPDLQMDLSFPIQTPDMGAPRVILYASSEAINRAWVSNLGVTYWLSLIASLTELVGPVTLIAAQWDEPFSKRLAAAASTAGVEYEDLTGQTTLPEVADVIKNARVLIGVISGMTILANHFRTPTVAIYPTAHHQDFPRTWVAPDAPYLPICATDTPPARELAMLAQAMVRKPQ